MSRRERKLTPAEQKRKAAFEAVCAEMARAGYIRKNFLIGIVQANTLSVLVMLPFLALAAWLYSPCIAAGGDFFLGGQFLLLFAALLVLLVVHESAGRPRVHPRADLGFLCPKPFCLHLLRRHLEGPDPLLHL